MRPAYKIEINGKDATTELTAYVESVGYTDRVAGQSDEAEFTVNNADGRFTGENPAQDWRFAKGDKVDISLGYGDDLTFCGTFTVDQVEAHYNPSQTVTVKALAAGINSPLRTRKTVAHDGKSLRQIADAVASQHGFTIDDGTSFTTREQANWKAEREALTTAAAAINKVLALLNLQNEPIQFAGAVTNVLAQYTPIIECSERLAVKGRADYAATLRAEATLWYTAWRNKYFPSAKKVIHQARAASASMSSYAASLVDVDRTTTRSKLDITTTWHMQDNETDLEYMGRLSKANGILFSVRGNVMVFTSIYDVEAAPSYAILTKPSIMSARFTDKQTKTYAGAEVEWHDPETAEPIRSRYVMQEPPPSALPGSYQLFQSVNEFGTGEVLKVKERVETQAQADEVAKAAIHNSVSHQFEGEITVTGSPTYCAGINVEIQGFGFWDGKWAVTESRHTIAPDYTTILKIKRGK